MKAGLSHRSRRHESIFHTCYTEYLFDSSSYIGLLHDVQGYLTGPGFTSTSPASSSRATVSSDREVRRCKNFEKYTTSHPWIFRHTAAKRIDRGDSPVAVVRVGSSQWSGIIRKIRKNTTQAASWKLLLAIFDDHHVHVHVHWCNHSSTVTLIPLQAPWHLCKYKYLRVTITDDLSWTAHVNIIASKSRKLTGLLYRQFYPWSSSPALLKLYTTLVRPHLEYAAPVWSPHFTKDHTI